MVFTLFSFSDKRLTNMLLCAEIFLGSICVSFEISADKSIQFSFIPVREYKYWIVLEVKLDFQLSLELLESNSLIIHIYTRMAINL